jgi:hypothetical protein
MLIASAVGYAGALEPTTDEVTFILPAQTAGLMTGDDTMIVDCGATKHCIPDASRLYTITDSSPKHKVRIGNGKKLDVTAIGELAAHQGQYRDPRLPQEEGLVASRC